MLPIEGTKLCHHVPDGMLFNVKRPLDLDQEDLSDIFARLDACQSTLHCSLIPIQCSCDRPSNTGGYTKSKDLVYDSVLSEEQSPGSEQEDEDFRFNDLLKTLSVQARKGTNTSASVIRNLTQSYNSLDQLTEHQMNQILLLLKHNSPALQEGALITLRQISCVKENCMYLLERDVLSDLLYMLELETTKHLHGAVAACIETITQHQSLDEHWEELMITVGLMCLLRRLTPSTPDCTRLAVACAIRSLAAHKNMAILILDHGMSEVSALKDMRDKFKEVFTQILSNLVLHTDHTRASVLDEKALPIALNMLSRGPCGPQQQALMFIKVLSSTKYGLSAVVEENVIPPVLASLNESKCRKVREAASSVLCQIVSTRRVSFLKSVFLQIDGYYSRDRLVEAGAGTPDPVTSTRRKADLIEKGIREFIKTVINILCREARIDLSEDATVTEVHLKPCIDTSPLRLTLITNLVRLLGIMTSLPLHRSRAGTFGQGDCLRLDSLDPRSNQLKVNSKLVHILLASGCMCVVDLLRCYTSKLQFVLESQRRLASKKRENAWTGIEPTKRLRRAYFDLSSVFEDVEIKLVEEILNTVTRISWASCEAHRNTTEDDLKMREMRNKYIKPAEGDKRKQHEAYKKPEGLVGCGDTTVCEQDRKKHEDVYTRLSSTQKRNLTDSTESHGLWDPRNPFLTMSFHKDSRAADLEEEYCHKQDQKLNGRRRHVRRTLYNSGAIEALSCWLHAGDIHITTAVLDTLHSMILPLIEKLQPGPPEENLSKRSSKQRRPCSASRAEDNRKKLQSALGNMTSEMASLIKTALGPTLARPSDVSKRQRPASANVKSQSGKCRPASAKEAEFKGDRHANWKVSLDPSQPISPQCRWHVFEVCGEYILDGLLSKSAATRRACLLYLQDFVSLAETSILIKLSQLGCMPRLLDFLRINDDDELLEAIGLIVARLLMTRDVRFKELFRHHGGPRLLMVLARTSQGVLREEVALTLKSVSDRENCKNRGESHKATDIWDQILKRWKTQDKVAGIFQRKVRFT